MEKPISIKLAKEISLKKWEEILDNFHKGYPFCTDSEFLNDYPYDLVRKLSNHFSCGFCYRHNYSGPSQSDYCKECEFGKIAGMCTDDNSLYDKYCESENIILEKDSNKEGISIVEQIIEAIKQIDENEV